MARDIELVVKLFDPDTGKELKKGEVERLVKIKLRTGWLYWFLLGAVTHGVVYWAWVAWVC